MSNTGRVVGTGDDGRAFVRWASGNTSWISSKGGRVDKGKFPDAFRPTAAQRKNPEWPHQGDIVLTFPDQITLFLGEDAARAAQHALAVALGNGVNGPTLAEKIWEEAAQAYGAYKADKKDKLAQGHVQGLALALSILLSRDIDDVKKEVVRRSKK